MQADQITDRHRHYSRCVIGRRSVLLQNNAVFDAAAPRRNGRRPVIRIPGLLRTSEVAASGDRDINAEHMLSATDPAAPWRNHENHREQSGE